MDKAKLKRWSTIFRALANPNRLKIIKILSSGESLPVSSIARDIKISLKSTSKHLIMLKNLETNATEESPPHFTVRCFKVEKAARQDNLSLKILNSVIKHTK